jgi:hypothetical protein
LFWIFAAKNFSFFTMPESPQLEQKQNYSQTTSTTTSTILKTQSLSERSSNKIENKPRKCLLPHKALKAPVPLRPSASASLAKQQKQLREEEEEEEEEGEEEERTFRVFEADLQLELEGTLSELISSFNMPTLEKSPSPQHKADLLPSREPNPLHKVLLQEYPGMADCTLGLFCASPVTHVKDDDDVFNL